MAWTTSNPVVIGGATKKINYDNLWDNAQYNKDTFEIEHASDGIHMEGMIVQVVEATPYTTVTSTTAQLSQDNSIPQITEGTEINRISITPRSTTNSIIVVTSMPLVYFQSNGISFLCRNDESDAIAISNGQQQITWEQVAGTTSEITFKLRVARFTGGGSPVWINQTSLPANLGGIASVRMRVFEMVGPIVWSSSSSSSASSESSSSSSSGSSSSSSVSSSSSSA